MPRWNIHVSIDSRGVVTGAGRAGDATQRMAGKMRTADRVTARLNRTLKSLGLVLGGALLVRGLRGTIDLMAEQETAVRRLESRLRGLGPEALASSGAFRQMATDLQRATGIADEEILRLQSVLLTFRHIGPEIFGELTETVLDVATVMGTDAKSAALQLGKALDDPARRVSELSRAGITFTQQQQDVIKALVETGDLLGAQKLVLAEVRAQYGKAARDEGETLRKKLDELGNSWGDLIQQIGESSGAGNPIVAVVQAGIDILRAATDYLADFDNQWNAFMLSLERGARELLSIQLSLAEFAPGDQGEESLRGMIAALDDSIGNRIPKYIHFLQELQDRAAGVTPEVAGFGRAVEATAPQVEKATKAVRTLADALKEASERAGETISAAGGLSVRLAGFAAERNAATIKAAFGGNLPEELAITIADAIGEETYQHIKNATERAGDDAASGFASSLSSSVGQALANAILSGDVTSAIDGLSRSLGAVAAQSITASLGGGVGATVAGSVAGPLVGALAGELLGGLFGGHGPPPWVTKFLGAVDVFDHATGELAAAATTVRDSLNSLDTLTGGSGLFRSSLAVSQTGPDEFSARIGGIFGGLGGTAEEAARVALDSLAQNFAQYAQAFGFDFSGVTEAIATALRESTFASFDEMVGSLETWNEALNSVTTTLGAWTPATDAAMQRLAMMRLEIERSGLSAAAAAPFLAELGRSAAILTSQARGGFLSSIAEVMERMGLSAQQAATFRARAEQISFQLTVAKLRVEAAALGFVGTFWNRLFAGFEAFGANINNFVQSAANIVAPVIRAAPSVARSLSNGLARLREDLVDYLARLRFAPPGSPRPGKAGLNAALDEAQAAAAAGDVQAFQSASDAALTIAQELFGQTAGFDAVLDQILALGEFDPVEQIDPIVGAIGDLGTSISGDLIQLDESILEHLQITTFALGDMLGANILAFADSNFDGLLSLTEAQGLLSDATFALLDVNEDGFLSLEELSSDSARTLFDLLDVNKDGNLTLEELLAEVEELPAVIEPPEIPPFPDLPPFPPFPLIPLELMADRLGDINLRLLRLNDKTAASNASLRDIEVATSRTDSQLRGGRTVVLTRSSPL